VTKEAKLENAIEGRNFSIQVPLFVSQDDVVEIDTRTHEFKKVVRG